MNPARAGVVAIMVVLVLAWGVWRAGPSREAPIPTQPARNLAPAIAHPPNGIVAAPNSEFIVEPGRDSLAGLVGEGLNAIGGTVQRDLSIVSDLLDAWQTNFPGQGNPVGLNTEITAALTGRNALRLEFVPADHPAINATGELCDRWGSPLVFHQISGTHMEIRSAGPDRRPYTDDDVIWVPGSP